MYVIYSTSECESFQIKIEQFVVSIVFFLILKKEHFSYFHPWISVKMYDWHSWSSPSKYANCTVSQIQTHHQKCEFSDTSSLGSRERSDKSYKSFDWEWSWCQRENCMFLMNGIWWWWEADLIWYQNVSILGRVKCELKLNLNKSDYNIFVNFISSNISDDHFTVRRRMWIAEWLCIVIITGILHPQTSTK